MMLGALGGLLAVSFLIVRKPAYVGGMSLAYTVIALAVTFGVPFV